MTALKTNLARLLRTALIMIGAAAMLAATPAHAWWDKDWKYRKQVTIDTTASGVNVSGAIGRSVVLVRLHSGNFTFTDSLENGADIRVIDADDKTPLPFHVESFNAKDGIATLWVSVPAVNGGEKKNLWIYFGNSNAKVGEDPAGTFDADHIGVFHFGEATGQPAADRTANANSAVSAVPGVNESGIIGRSARFPGQGAITVNPSPSLALPAGSPFTFSAWVKPEALTGSAAVFARGGVVIGLNAGVPFATAGGSLQGTAPLKQGEWAHLALVADGTTVKLYVNGVEAAAASATLPALDGPLTIGGAEGMPFTGEIDEVRLSRIARPAAMLMLMANAEGPANKLVGVSESAEKQGGGGGVFGFVISKLHAIDAAIVVLCLVLLAGAIALMVSKIRYLNSAQRANLVFRKRFHEMHEELVTLEDIPGIAPTEVEYMKQNSPLARLYTTGIEELQVRQRSRGARALTGEAVEAMRSAVDAGVVGENQTLDRLMVILTIAISGGPFIGLLGTVIGVMSTFGGVAMAGDVNVNAIAPGIAAALLATIAGMACAIPSLFGYNYINSRISGVSDEMRVFVDRLITRLAEMQAERAEAAQLAVAAE